jgi:hypothetical protein
MQEENHDFGVSKDLESYTDVVGRQLSYINQLITGGANQKLIENALSVLEALLSPYLPDNYLEELKTFETQTIVSLRRIRSDEVYYKEKSVISRFLLNKYSLLLKFAKERGFLPKTLSW